LLEEGFDTLARLAHIEASDLSAMGTKRGHARQLLRAAVGLRATEPSDALLSGPSASARIAPRSRSPPRARGASRDPATSGIPNFRKTRALRSEDKVGSTGQPTRVYATPARVAYMTPGSGSARRRSSWARETPSSPACVEETPSPRLPARAGPTPSPPSSGARNRFGFRGGTPRRAR
jgi:hypothetical protein